MSTKNVHSVIAETSHLITPVAQAPHSEANALALGLIHAMTDKDIVSFLDNRKRVRKAYGERYVGPPTGNGVTERDSESDGAYAVAASAVPRERTEWLVPGRVPVRAVSLLVGDPGLGKSMLTCLWAADLSRGQLGEKGVTLMASAEDSLPATIVPRLEAVGADLDAVRFVHLRREGVDEGLTIPNDVPELIHLVEETGARLVVIDPLMAHLPDHINSWRDQSVRRALAPLHMLADHTGCAVVAVAHLNKGSGRDPIYRVGGSIGVIGAARSSLLFARDPDDPDGEKGTRRVLAHSKCNVGPEAPSQLYEIEPILLAADGSDPDVETARLRYLGESEHTDRSLLTVVNGEEQSELDEAKNFLRDELAEGARRAKEVLAASKEAGIAKRTLDRAKKELRVESTKLPHGWQWELKDQGCQGGWQPSFADDLGNLGDVGSNPHGNAEVGGTRTSEDGQGCHLSDIGNLGALGSDPVVDDAELERLRTKRDSE